MRSNCTHSPNIEAMVGIWSIFSPLEQRPLKLHSDLGGGVRRKLDQHLQQVGPHAILRRLVVDVAWQRKKNISRRSSVWHTCRVFVLLKVTHWACCPFLCW